MMRVQKPSFVFTTKIIKENKRTKRTESHKYTIIIGNGTVSSKYSNFVMYRLFPSINQHNSQISPLYKYQ